jgi:hypothetical protein
VCATCTCVHAQDMLLANLEERDPIHLTPSSSQIVPLLQHKKKPPAQKNPTPPAAVKQEPGASDVDMATTAPEGMPADVLEVAAVASVGRPLLKMQSGPPLLLAC